MSRDGLTSFLFSTPDMANVFSPQAQLRAMTRFEWALSSALEANGLAEAGSAAALEKLLDADFVDLAPLLRDARDAGNIAIPFVRQLTAAVKAHSEIAARSVHLGATSQDVLDSALVLQMKEALQLLDGALTGLDAALMEKVRRYRGTLMLGRTWLQAGPPITLGLKLAGVLAALRRDRQRIRQEEERLLVLQFGGAVGTQASLGSSGGGVSAKVAQFLDLAEPELPWHTQRDSLTAIVQLLALVTGTLAKLGTGYCFIDAVGSGGSVGGRGRGTWRFVDDATQAQSCGVRGFNRDPCEDARTLRNDAARYAARARARTWAVASGVGCNSRGVSPDIGFRQLCD